MTNQILGDEKIGEREIPTLLYKSLPPSIKWRRQFNKTTLQNGIQTMEKVYHPMWITKMLVIADRKPFSPKITPNMTFIDAVSGYRGLFPSVPPIVSKKLSPANTRRAEISENDLTSYIQDIQDKQINRRYVLKKPRYEIKETQLVYLPLWKVEVDTASLKKTFFINGNTGEPEGLLQELWDSDKWKLS